MVNTTTFVPVPPALVADTVTENDATTVVGVPLITPVEVFRVNPAGNVVEL